MKIAKNIIFIAVLTIIVICSLFVRTKLWTFALPFYGDEISLLDNIQQRNYWGLFLPLDNDQCCPPLLLVLGKLIISKFGFNELAIRAIPFASSFLSVLAFCYLSFLIFKNKISIIVANLLFLYSENLLLYSFAFKQYSFDCLAAILVLIAAIKLKDKEFSYKTVVLFSLLTICLFLFSFTSLFVVLSSLFVLFVYRVFIKGNGAKNFIEILKSDIFRQNLLKVMLFCVFPLGIFLIIFYYMYFMPTYIGTNLVSYWNGGFSSEEFFVPRNVEQWNNFVWFLCPMFSYITNNNIFIYGVWIILSIIFLCKKDLFSFCLIVFPFVFAYLLGVFYLYPFAASRITSYLSPVFIILITYLFELLCFHIVAEIVVIIGLLFAFSKFQLPFYDYNYDYFNLGFNNGERLSKYCLYALNHSDIQDDDYIYVVHKLTFNFEDRDKVYAKNPKIWKGYFVFDDLPKRLYKVEKGRNIYFWLDDYEREAQNYDSELQWIDEHCDILYSVKDYYGTFMKCKVTR